MALERTVTIVTQDSNNNEQDITLKEVNPTLPGASLQAAVSQLVSLSANTYVTAYVTDKVYITDIS